jgi:hypothetical protein
MAIKPFVIQRRMMELGRVRLGEKGSRGEPKKLTTLRFTSASKLLLDAIAEKHGGTVRPWEAAPDEGYFEITTDASAVDIILPPVYSAEDGSPTAPYSQFFEQWSAGGCVRRCDGETETVSGKPCMCNPAERDCKITTRVSFMLPDIPGLGVWRLESHGYNAAVELPGTLEVLLMAAAEHKFIPAVLRIEQRTKKVPGEGTRRFIVPVIELPHVTVKQLVSGDVPQVINAPTVRSTERPALPAGPAPANGQFENDVKPGFGAPPALPDQESASVNSGAEADEPPAAPITAAQAKKLDVLVGRLREGKHIKTQQLYAALAKAREVEEPILVDILDGIGEDGELHWAPLRKSLTKIEAIDLIRRLETLEANVQAPA